jgi:hypothetical protein
MEKIIRIVEAGLSDPSVDREKINYIFRTHPNAEIIENEIM